MSAGSALRWIRPTGTCARPYGQLYANDFINRFPPTIELPPEPLSTVRQLKLASLGDVARAALNGGNRKELIANKSSCYASGWQPGPLPTDQEQLLAAIRKIVQCKMLQKEPMPWETLAGGDIYINPATERPGFTRRGGLRVSEALALYPKDVDAESGTVTILHGKGDRRRTVGLDPEAFAIVMRWLERRPVLKLNGRHALFCTLQGTPK